MKKILLIEDNADILYANRVMLELEGYEVLLAKNAGEGRRKAYDEKPDLIVLDISLPDADGIDLCSELCAKQDFKILFLSAIGTEESMLAAIKAGGYDYVAKPYLMETLLRKISDVL